MNPIISYYKNGEKYSEEYYNGSEQFHNINGPALIYYYENGKIFNKFYYLNDKEISVDSDEEFQKYIKRLNIS